MVAVISDWIWSGCDSWIDPQTKKEEDMNFITDNIETIGAVIGAAFVLARVVVSLTPTPKDNTAVESASTWLTMICKIFGLDLTQGVNKKEK